VIQITWPGIYLDGKRAARQEVTVHLHNDGLRITGPGGEIARWGYGEIRQVQGFYAGEPVRLERRENLPGALIVEDEAFLASLRGFAPAAGRRFHDPAFRSARLKLTVLATVAVAVLGLALYRWGIPLMAAAVAPLVPAAWEEGLGRSALGLLAPEEARCTDPQLARAVAAIVARLRAPQPQPSPFRVYVVDAPVFNAVALPGGAIVIFRGLLSQTGSPEELAGVVAHEMQHILKRHATKRIIEEASTGLLLTLVSGDVTGAMMYGAKIAENLAKAGYSRRDEEEADAGGVRMLLAAGIDPAGMIGFFETVQKTEPRAPSWFKYLATHPEAAQRASRLRSLAAARLPRDPPPAALPGGADWEQIRKGCGAALPARQPPDRGPARPPAP
jgi:Zn-dependent protease with chaperone function